MDKTDILEEMVNEYSCKSCLYANFHDSGKFAGDKLVCKICIEKGRV